MDAEAENQLNTKPCPYNKAVSCVQYPDDNCCGCNPCDECEIKLCTPKLLAQFLDEYIEHEVELNNIESADMYAYNSWRQFFEQALDAYESTENVVIQIIKKKAR